MVSDWEKHIVFRNKVELVLPSQDNALAIREDISHLIKEKLFPVLDNLFSRISGPGEILRIERLVVDVGKISIHKLDEIVSKVEEDIELQILKIKKKTGTHGRTIIQANQKSSIVVSTVNDLQIVLYFLEHGNLPWHVRDQPSFEIDKMLLSSLEENKQQTLGTLKILFQKKTARDRFVFQIDESVKERILSLIDQEISQPFFEIKRLVVEWLKEIGSTNTVYRRADLFLWANYLDAIFQRDFLNIGKSPGHLLEEIFLPLLKHLSKSSLKPQQWDQFNEMLSLRAENGNTAAFHLKSFLGKMAHKFHIPNFEKNKDFADSSRQEPGSSRQKGTEDTYNAHFLNGNDITLGNVGDREISEPGHYNLHGRHPASQEDKEIEDHGPERVDRKTQSINVPADVNDLHISNAGLVLLHPFLKYFFEGLGLMKNDSFIDEYSNFKAVHLLHFLVTQQEDHPEHELALNKILCGLNVTDPVPLSVDLSTEEKEECEYLLLAVLDQWKALKTRSTESLRETFLKREGMLTYQSGWTLKVERNTFDILLEKLPWGFSLIKLSWNPEIIYVEW
jgi:hypothetical protein